MEFFASAVDTLKVLVMAIGCGLGAWGILPSRKQTTSLMMNFPHGLKMKRKIFKSWSMLENGQKQKRQKHLSITMKSLNLF